MTGLDPDRCHILEIASLVTDADLVVLAEGPNLVIHNEEEQLATLSDWSREFFGRSGLLERVRASTTTCAEAEQATLAFLRQWVPEYTSPLCGNSVHSDRFFLWRHMRELHDYCHYRNIDVSSFKHLIRSWYPDRCNPPPKSESHEALQDIRDSVAELVYYRQTFLIPS